MNKDEFIARVAESAGLTRAAATRAVDAIFDTASGAISEAVHAAGSFSIPGFGKFTKKTRAARTGRNPRTGTEISIPERTTVAFTAGKGLKSGTSTSRRKASTSGSTADSSSGGGAKRATKSTGNGATAAKKSTATKSAGATKSTGAAKKSTSSRSGSKAS